MSRSIVDHEDTYLHIKKDAPWYFFILVFGILNFIGVVTYANTQEPASAWIIILFSCLVINTIYWSSIGLFGLLGVK